MAKYRITGPDGGTYELDAPNEQALQTAVTSMFSQALPDKGPTTVLNQDQQPVTIAPGTKPDDQRRQVLASEGLSVPGEPFDAVNTPPAPVSPSVSQDGVFSASPAIGSMAGAAGDYAGQSVAVGERGARRGVAALAGMPVDLVNAGMNAVGLPTSDQPFMGSGWVDQLLGAPARAAQQGLEAAGVQNVPDADTGAEPADPLQRIIQRIGYELGASALPTAGAMAIGPAMGRQAARSMAETLPQTAAPSAIPGGQAVKQFGNDVMSAIQSQTGRALETAAVSPGSAAARTATGAVAAGTGAGIGNEIAGNEQIGPGNFYSDLIGSILGVGGTSMLTGAGGAVGNLIRGTFGRPGYASDVVGREVADRLINNSTDAAGQFAATGKVDTAPIGAKLRTPSAAEEVIPGYQANIGDRSQDPGLATFAYNQDAAMPGASIERRAGNDAAVNERMQGLQPQGNPSQFRADLQGSVDQRTGAADNAAADANAAFNRSTQQLRSTMTGETRGADIRAALEDSSGAARDIVAQAWAPLNQSPLRVDTQPLADAYGAISNRLSTAENRRFLPNEAGIPGELAPTPPGPPVNTGLLDADGLPIMRPGAAGQQTAPIREITGLRSALSDARREALTAGRQAEARVIGQHIDALDTYVSQAVPPEWRDTYDAARGATRDYADRFDRPQTAIAQTLDRQQGLYRQPDSGVAQKFVQDDNGRISDFQALIRESGADPRVRGAVRDQMLSDIQNRGLMDNPTGLEDYLGRYGTVLDQFPDLRQQLTQAAGSRRAVDTAVDAAATTRQDLTTPGRSPEASYLKYGDDRTIDSVRTAINAPDPRAATRQLIQAAGGTPEAIDNARAAFWTDLQKGGQLSSPGVTNEQRWSGRKLRDLLNDPKRGAALEELYANEPEKLADMATVFDALAGAENSIRAKAAGTSGTAQGRGAVTGRYDPALSTSSLASRVRSVHRGQLSPTIAGIDVLATWMRRRSAQVQGRAIDTLTSAVINNPDMAADLLDRFNPADYAARRRVLLQKYGVRATQVLNLLDEAQQPQDDVKEAISGDNR